VVYRVMKPGPKPWEMIADVWNRTISVFNALLHSKQTGVGPKDLSGPVGIIAMLAIWVNTDYRLALYSWFFSTSTWPFSTCSRCRFLMAGMSCSPSLRRSAAAR